MVRRTVAAVQPRKPTNDAEAICTAVLQPTMRFVPVKSEVQQAILMQHRTRDFLVRQLTQLANAIRAHLGEFGLVVSKGVHNMGRLVAEAGVAELPLEARAPLNLLVGQFTDTKARIDAITADLRRAAEADETARRLQTMPGIGPITASVLAATLPDVSAFRSARDLSAWLGVRSVSRTDRVPARTAEATLKRRQGTARLNLEDGKPVYPAAALPRGDGGNLYPQAHRPGRRLAGWPDPGETTLGGGDRLG
jgi:transposase